MYKLNIYKWYIKYVNSNMLKFGFFNLIGLGLFSVINNLN